MLTFLMSTFRENSGGNLVDFKSLVSTGVAMLTGAVQELEVCERNTREVAMF